MFFRLLGSSLLDTRAASSSSSCTCSVGGAEGAGEEEEEEEDANISRISTSDGSRAEETLRRGGGRDVKGEEEEEAVAGAGAGMESAKATGRGLAVGCEGDAYRMGEEEFT